MGPAGRGGERVKVFDPEAGRWLAGVALWPARGGPSGRRMVLLPDGSLEFLNLASERVRLARAVRATGRRLQAGADREGPAPGAPAPGRRGAAAQRARAGAPPAGLPAEAPKAVPRKKRRGRSAGTAAPPLPVRIPAELVPPKEIDAGALRAWGAKRARTAPRPGQRGDALAPWTPERKAAARSAERGVQQPVRAPPLNARTFRKGRGVLASARALLSSASVSSLLAGPTLRTALRECADAQPATSGCSYAVASESRQEGSRNAPLPGLAFRPLRPGMAPPPSSLHAARDCLARLERSGPLLAVLLPARDEAASRPYLLRPEGRSAAGRSMGAGDPFRVNLGDLPAHLQERHVLCVLLRYAGEAGCLRSASSAEDSDVQMTLFTRRCQAGTTTLRSLVAGLAESSPLVAEMNVVPMTLGVKTEMFASRELLQRLGEPQQMALLALTHLFEKRMAQAGARESAERLEQLWRKIERAAGCQEAQAAVTSSFGLTGAPAAGESDSCSPEETCAALALACFFAQSKVSSAKLSSQGRTSFPWPLHMAEARDSYSYELVPQDAACEWGSRTGTRRSFSFPPRVNLPPNFNHFQRPEGSLAVGATTYINLFTDEELTRLEEEVRALVGESEEGTLPPESFESAYVGTHRRRTKMFFGYRYLWTAEQLESPTSKIAAGVRADVPPVPPFVQQGVVRPLVAAGVLPENFVNSCAVNIYHDGSEGIASHFDDSSRFNRPIVTLRLFSDSRLSFGGRLLGCCNSEFVVPMPRGCVTVLEPGTYAADGIKHAIKPIDMTGQSAAVILRQIRPEVRLAAEKLRLDDTGDWFALLSLQDGALSHRAATRLREQEHVVLMQCQQVVAAAVAGALQSHRCDLARQRVEAAATRQCQELLRKMVAAVAREVASPTRIGGGAWRGIWEHNPYAPTEVMTYEEGRQWRSCAGVVREAVWATMRLERREDTQRGLAEKHQLKELRSFVGDIVRDVEREAYDDSNAVATLVGDLVATVADRAGRSSRPSQKKREYLKRRRPREWPHSPAEWKRLTRREQDMWYDVQGDRKRLVSEVMATVVRHVEREAYDDSHAAATVVGDLVATVADRTGQKPHIMQKKREYLKRRRPRDWPRSPAEWKRLTRGEQDAWYAFRGGQSEAIRALDLKREPWSLMDRSHFGQGKREHLREEQDERYLQGEREKLISRVVATVVRDVERGAYADSSAVATVVGDLVATVADRAGKKPRVEQPWSLMDRFHFGTKKQKKKREYLKRRRPREWPHSPAEWKRLTRREQDVWYDLRAKRKGGPPSPFRGSKQISRAVESVICDVEQLREVRSCVGDIVCDIEREAYSDANAIATIVSDLFATVAHLTGRKPRVVQQKKPDAGQKGRTCGARTKREKRRRPKDWPRSPAEWKRLPREDQDAWYKSNRPSWWNSCNVRTHWTQPIAPQEEAEAEAEVGENLGLSEEVERIRLEARLEREALINSCYVAAAGRA